MRLIDHVSIAVQDLNRTRPFYIAVMSVLGAVIAYDRADAIGFGERNRGGDDGHSYLSVYVSKGAAADPKRHWCFRAADRAGVDAFHGAGLATGGLDAGKPGLRAEYHPSYYAAFLEDPEGNKIEAVCHIPGQ